MWLYLKNGTLETKLLRQYIIGDYIVDFLIPYYNIVLEVDGGYHAERSQQESDELRSCWLNSQGFYVMRFKNEEILTDPDGSIERIKELINRIKNK